MSAQAFAKLESVAEQMSLRDLAALAEIRRARTALDREEAEMARQEQAELEAATDPLSLRMLETWRAALNIRRRKLAAERKSLMEKENIALKAATTAIGRKRAIARLRKREEDKRRAAAERREEQSLSSL